MKQKIYELLNDITIDLHQYIEEVDEVTEKKWISNAKRSVRKREFKNILKPVAAVIILAIGTGYTLPVYAMTNSFLYKIADFMGVTKDLDRYSSVINKTVVQKGLMIQLGEVLLDNDEVTVTMRITSEEPLPRDFWIEDCDIYINGKGIKLEGISSERKLDEYTWEVAVSQGGIGEFQGDVDVKIIFREFRMNKQNVKGKWTFEFTANGDELEGETVEISLQERMMLPGGEEIIIERYTANEVSQKIYFKKLLPISDYQMEFGLYNEAGDKFKLQSSSIDAIGGVFKWEGIGSESKSETLILNLRVAEWGKEYEQVDKELRIDLCIEGN